MLKKIFALGLVLCALTAVLYGKDNSAFTQTERVRYEKDIVYTYKHKKLGMEVIWIKNDDIRKSFILGVKTPTTNSTGVNHIIEHTVLTGSKKYPGNNLFFDAGEAYPNIYMNALTSGDMTMFPFCTPYDSCFENLLDIYLDSIFNPDMLRQPNSFYEESFHYNPHTKAFGGVVYNEMKGAGQSKDRILYTSIRKAIYQGTHYAYDSGGVPDEIPMLTYESFVSTYKKYYHPQNMKIVLYGNLDIHKTLNTIDSYINTYTPGQTEENLIVKPKVTEANQRIPYPSDTDDTQLVKCFVVRQKLSTKERTELDLWVQTYLIHPNSFFQKQLNKLGIVNTKIYKDDDLPYPIYSIIIEDVSPSKREVYKKQLINLLEDIKKMDIRDKRLEQDTLRELKIAKSQQDGDIKRGIEIGESILDAWAHEKETYQYYLSKESIRKLNSISPKYKKLLLETSAEKFLELESEKTREEKAPLQISTVPSEKWEEIMKSLEKWQNNKEKAIFPEIDMNQLIIKPKTEPQIKKQGNTTYILNVVDSELAQTQLYYNTGSISQENLPYLKLYSYFLTESAKEETPYTGYLSAETVAIGHKEGYTPYLKLSFLTDSSNKKHGEMLQTARKGLLQKEDSWYENKLEKFILNFEEEEKENILGNLARMSCGSLEGASRYNYEMGYPVYKLCCDLKAQKDRQWIVRVKGIDSSVYSSQGLVVGIAASKDNIKIYQNNIKKLIASQRRKTFTPREYVFKAQPKNSVCFMNTPVDYIYMFYQNKDSQITGIDYVAGAYLTKNYLSPIIRQKKGAYGAGLTVTAPQTAVIYTYRDPDYENSLHVFNQIGDELKKIDEKSLRGAQKEALSRVHEAFKLFASDMERADVIERNYLGSQVDSTALQYQIIQSTTEDVRKRAQFYEKVPKQAALSVATNTRKKIIFSDKKVYEVK